MTHVELNYLDHGIRFIVWHKWINTDGGKLKFDIAHKFQHISLVLNEEYMLKFVAVIFDLAN